MITSKMAPVEREVAHEAGNFMSFRILTARQMDEVHASGLAEVAKQATTFAGVKDLIDASGSEGKLAAAAAESTLRAERGVQSDVERLAGLDRTLLVRYGLVAWRGPCYDGEPCEGAAKDELDEQTRNWAALQALDVSELTTGEAESSAPGIAASDMAGARLES